MQQLKHKYPAMPGATKSSLLYTGNEVELKMHYNNVPSTIVELPSVDYVTARSGVESVTIRLVPVPEGAKEGAARGGPSSGGTTAVPVL